MEGLGGQLRYAPPVCSGGGEVKGGGPRLELSGGGHPGRCTETVGRTQQEARPSHCPVHLVRSGNSDAHQPQPAPSRDPGSMPARPPARSPCGRSRSRRQVALGVWPSLPESRRARPSGHPARPSPRSAPRSPHLRPLAIFTPPSGPAWAPDSVLSN